jgi:pyruvate/2-oxoglutarate dehydrogenase complex dihydrolipoamide acyltransferase (E2) component
MAYKISIPAEGGIETGIIVKWNVKAGDRVQAGDPLCEVETDKTAFTVESFCDATILGITRSEGEEVPVLEMIGFMGEPGETIDDVM